MGDNAAARFAAKRFEPILIFHPDERFFPIDPKWYLERSALWRAIPSFTDKKNWGEPPLTSPIRLPQVPRNNLAALQSESPGSSGAVWIGDPAEDFGVELAPQGQQVPAEEHFLDFGGWEPPQPASSEVTTTSTNRFAALDPAEYSERLADSRPWYYVEYLSNQDLLHFTVNRKPNGLDLFDLVANNSKLSAPQALVYHFFFPVHDEGLEGCDATTGGPTFGSFAGEWGSIAILLNSANDPTFIGLTSRNIGDPSIVGIEEQRVGMSVFPWSGVQTVASSGAELHPKIFVSKGTHGYYLSPGAHAVSGFTPGADVSGGSCGHVEAMDDTLSSEQVLSPGDPGHDSSVVLIALKCVSVILVWWGVIEINSDRLPIPEIDATPTQPTDQTAGSGAGFGKIIRPNGLVFPEAALSPALVDWNVDLRTAADGRSYDSAIDRSTQLWWVPRTEARGFSGRWGPRVTNDPNSRRCGMKCPDFLIMFLEAIAIQMLM